METERKILPPSAARFARAADIHTLNLHLVDTRRRCCPPLPPPPRPFHPSADLYATAWSHRIIVAVIVYRALYCRINRQPLRFDRSIRAFSPCKDDENVSTLMAIKRNVRARKAMHDGKEKRTRDEKGARRE